MTTQRILRPARPATVIVASLISMFLLASPAVAQVGGVGDVTGTAGGAASGATDTVTDTASGATETVTETVGGAGDTVTGTVGGATDTVNETVGGATDTVDETVGGVTDTVNDATGGNSGGEESPTGSGPAGSKGTTTSSAGSLDGAGSGSGANGANDGGRVGDGAPLPPDATVIKLPDGSTIVVPGNSGGSIDGRTVGAGNLPKEVLAALGGLTDGFASAGAATPLTTKDVAPPEGPTFLENASRLAAEAAKKAAFPAALLVIVLGFLMVHGKIGRRDPKLSQARIDTKEDALTFR